MPLKNGQCTSLSKILNVITSETFGDVFLRIFTAKNEENIEGRLKNFYFLAMSFNSKTISKNVDIFFIYCLVIKMW